MMRQASGCFLCAAIALAALSSRAAEPTPGQQEPTVQVEIVPLKKGSVPQVVAAYGSVEPSAAAQRVIMAPAAAVVDEIYVRIGQQVDKDAPLLRLLPSPATRTAFAQAQSALRVAADLVDRTRKMVLQHLATAQQLADAEKSQSDARAALTALQTQGAGGANLVRAPVAGVVTAISTSSGMIVAEGATLLALAGLEGLVLKVGVIPAQANAIKSGDPVTVTPLGGGTTVDGSVLMRGAMVDPNSGTVPVEIGLPAGKFLPGQSAAAAITTGQATGYLVPHAAVLVDDQGKRYVVQAVDHAAKQVPVEVLDSGGDQAVIQGALDTSAPVVVTGNHQLQNGMKIRLTEPSDKAGP
jgi:RND family efflux transporter MFP subunit